MMKPRQPIQTLPEEPQPGCLLPFCELETCSRETFQDCPRRDGSSATGESLRSIAAGEDRDQIEGCWPSQM